VPSVPLQTVGLVLDRVIIGLAMIETAVVVLEQLVVASIYSNVTPVPAETPSTTPELDTVALATLLEVHVPPVVGDRVMFPPTQTDAGAVTTGKGLTVIGAELVKHSVVGLVILIVVVPCANPVTTPVFILTLAIVASFDV
jgi:hypothetical protein